MMYPRLAVFHYKLNACVESKSHLSTQPGKNISMLSALHLQTSFSLFLRKVARRDFTISLVDSPCP